MLKQTAVALGLSLVAATGMAAESDAATGMADGAMAAKFKQLDTNGDGLLDQSEAAANPAVSSLYDSLDTNDTLEEYAKHPDTSGISLDQFEAGMQASQGGTVGPAVSGGETYKVYPDGSQEEVEGSGEAARGETSMDEDR